MALNRRKFHQLAMGSALAALMPKAVQAAGPAGLPKFSFMLWILPKSMSIDQRLEIVANAGYTGAELVTEWQGWSAQERKRVATKARSLGLVFDLIFPGRAALTDSKAGDLVRKQVTEAIPVAQELGCKQFGFASGPRVAGQSPQQQMDVITENLKIAGEIVAKAQMEVLLEPIDLLENKTAAVNSVEEAFQITRAVGNPAVKVLYDFYHEQRGAGNLIEKLEKNFDQVGLVHIADVPGRYRPGTGEMNYTMIYRKLAELGYNRYIAMEFYPTTDPVAELKAEREAVLKEYRR